MKCELCGRQLHVISYKVFNDLECHMTIGLSCENRYCIANLKEKEMQKWRMRRILYKRCKRYHNQCVI